MTTAEWVSEIFTEVERASIARLLCEGIAWSTPFQREQFIAAAEESVGNYQRLAIPLVEQRAIAIDRLEFLAKTGRSFRKAVDKLTSEAEEMMEQSLFVVGRKQGGGADGSLAEAAAMLKGIRDAAETAFFAATVATRSTRSARLSERQASDSLITDLAHAYMSAFGERPGFSRNSCFAKVLPRLLQAAGYHKPVGEDRRKRLIDSIGKGTPAKRGRRPNLN